MQDAMSKQAPEIFRRPVAEFTDTPDAPGAEDAVLQCVMRDYAARGFSAAVTVEGGGVRAVAVPDRRLELGGYQIGLLRQGFLQDALPSPLVLALMVDDRAVEYKLELSLSELGQTFRLHTVIRNIGFVLDDLRINVVQVFRELSPITDVKAI